MSYQLVGAVAALMAAASWAFATVLWRKIGDSISPLSMNLWKGIIGCIYLILILMVIGLEPTKPWPFFLLAVSGVIGISVGDTFFFMSLMHLGPRQASLMGTLNPVCIVLAAILILGERPSFLASIGIILTVSGVAWVLKERIPSEGKIQNKALGIKYGLVSILCTTVAVILAKISISSIPTLQATFIRLFFGAIGLVCWGLLRKELKSWIRPVKDIKVVKNIAFVVFIVVIGGFWLSLVALKYLDAGIATTLGSTAPLFILPMVFIVLHEKIKLSAVIGAVIAVCGIALIFIG